MSIYYYCCTYQQEAVDPRVAERLVTQHPVLEPQIGQSIGFYEPISTRLVYGLLFEVTPLADPPAGEMTHGHLACLVRGSPPDVS